jgi:hypothetical protein
LKYNHLATLLKILEASGRGDVVTMAFFLHYFHVTRAFRARADPTIVNHNTGVAKIINSASSLVRLKAKIFSSTLKNAVAYYMQRLEWKDWLLEPIL